MFDPIGFGPRRRPEPEVYPEDQMGQPDEASEVSSGRTPSREELQSLPRTVLLQIAIDLDPDAIAESYEEGWTKDDILKAIEKAVREAIVARGGKYVHDVEIFDSDVEGG